MKNDILQTIKSLYNALSDAEQKVGFTVLEAPFEVQYLSISELAEKAGVADATVSRFCKHLDLPGFYAFKIELAKALADNGVEEDNTGEFISLSKAEALKAVTDTAQKLDEKTMQFVAAKLTDAKRIVCMGSGGGMRIAEECAHVFSTVCRKCSAVSDLHNQMLHLATMGREDIMILFSYSGATKSGLELMELANKQGVFTVLVTAYEKSPIAKVADAVIGCACSEIPLRSGSICAKIAMLLPVDVLVKEYIKLNKETAESCARAIAEVMSLQHL